MTAPETIYAVPAIGGGWDDEMGMWAKTPTGIEFQAEYVLKSTADAHVAAAIKHIEGTIAVSPNMRELAQSILALTPPDAQAALQAMIDAAVKEAQDARVSPFDASDEVKSYLDGIIGVVEANSFEIMCLWQARGSRSWISAGHGYGPTISRLNGYPVCLSILTAIVDGHKIAFIDPTSQMVDWKMIDAWLQKNLPQSAMREDGLINKTDALNFYNIFPLTKIGGAS